MPYSREAMRAELDDLARGAAHVTIVSEKIRDVATAMRQELGGADGAFHTDPQQYPNESPPENDRRTLQFYLVVTSQEFCIWRRGADGRVEAWTIEVGGQRYVGARGIAAAHMRALRQGRDILDPTYLASMTFQDVLDFYRDEETGQVTLQMLPQRLAKFNELGRVLLDTYGGHVTNLLGQTGGYLFRGDDGGLVQRLLLDFPTSYFDWPFCKLAILLAKFLATRKTDGIPTTDEYRTLARIRDAENFEIAADYYIPLFFIRSGIFRVSDPLAAALRGQHLIGRDSRMEREYRACTIVAGRALAEETGRSLSAVDTECWKTGYLRCRLCREGISDEELPCPYRSVSKAYQNEHALMEMRWPLVLTTCY
ncbi:MAG TPA: queuosine salvage family protein [bacterium]|nr:queuosine salvage family protein [bacterium]